MNVMNALAGVLPNKEKKIEELERASAKANRLRELITHRSWPEFQRILDNLRKSVVQELGMKGMERCDWLRINHQWQLLDRISAEVSTALSLGTQADADLAKLKEKKDGGRTRKNPRSGSVERRPKD